MNSIHRKFREGVAIERVDLFRATLNEAQEIFFNLLEDIADYNKIIIDLSTCEYIDSTFFGAMVSALKKMRSKGGQLVLIIGETFIYKSYIYKEICSVFKVYHSVKDALQAVKNPEKKEIPKGYEYVKPKSEPAKIVQSQMIYVTE